MLIQVLFFSLVAGLAAMAGVFLVYYFSNWSRRNLIFLISFAIGVLLANAFFHLLPEAAALAPSWPYWALGALMFFYLIEQVLTIHACREEECEAHTLGHVGLLGLGFHSLVDGLTIGVAFQVGNSIGALTSLAVILHKISEGACLYTMLLGGRFSQKRSLWFSILVALATPLGAWLAYYFAQELTGQVLGWLLAAAAGGFIYIGASDLAPLTHKKNGWPNVLLMVLGVVFVWLIGKAI
ncbi:ZIP family metal transporter [Patescibacteria group bacterium]|nr:ZIP family metal transporter [Patescibacteria group bacterium]